jgi:hypothetical protein
MKPSRLTTVLTSMLGQRWPAFIWGPPGIGKSAIVHTIAKNEGLPVIDLRASLLDPTDLRGIPAIVDSQAVWCPPAFLPKEGTPPGVLFLDEINAAPPLVQASLYQLVLDRRVGEYVLPDGWWIVAAGNRQKDRAVTFRMSSALSNRFVHLDLDVDISDWRVWALSKNIDPLVVAFIGYRPALLREDPGESSAFPTPRSWEILSDVMKKFGGHNACADILPGIVGLGAATEFGTFVKRALNMKEMEEIISDPKNAKIPKSLDGLHVLTTWLVHSHDRDDVIEASAVLLNRIPPEFAVVLSKEMIGVSPTFTRNDGYKNFVKKNANIIAA